MGYKNDYLSEVKVLEDKGLIVVRNVYYAEYYDNPLDGDDYAGHLYGNLDRYGRSGYGDASDMNSAIGKGFDVWEGEVTEFDHEYEKALLMCVLEASVEEMQEYFDELVEEGEITLDSADEVVPYVQQLQHLMDFATNEWIKDTYPKIPSALATLAENRAKELVEKDISARVTGDDFAVAVYFSGNHGEYIRSTPDVSLLDIKAHEGVWVPSETLLKELKAMPRHEAIKRSHEMAESYCETLSMYAQGDVHDVDVKVYKLEFDEDDAPIDDAGYYEDEATALVDESIGWVLGSDYAEQEAKSLEEWAIEHAASELVKESSAQMKISM